jgi:two-component system LytT family sensor kinase
MAEELMVQMAAFLRSQITGSRPLTSLSDELRLVLAFVGVERARLGGRLRLEIACTPESLEMLVPSMVLQPLVENAIRHGIATRLHGGCIRIQARVTGSILHMVVADNGPGVRRPLVRAGETGWGLAGIRLRLAALWGADARLRLLAIRSRGTLAAVSLPAMSASASAPDVRPKGAVQS